MDFEKLRESYSLAMDGKDSPPWVCTNIGSLRNLFIDRSCLRREVEELLDSELGDEVVVRIGANGIRFMTDDDGVYMVDPPIVLELE